MSTNRAANKQLRRLLVAIEDAGATVVLGRGSRHWKIYVDDRLIAVLSGTASARQAHHRVRRDLRRAGLDVKVPR